MIVLLNSWQYTSCKLAATAATAVLHFHVSFAKLEKSNYLCKGHDVLSRNLGYKTRGIWGGWEVSIWLNVIWLPGSLPRSQTSGTGHSPSCWYCCPLCPSGAFTRGKFVLSRPRETMGYKTSGVAMLLKVVLTPQSIPRSQTSGTGTSASCEFWCLPCPTGGRY